MHGVVVLKPEIESCNKGVATFLGLSEREKNGREFNPNQKPCQIPGANIGWHLQTRVLGDFLNCLRLASYFYWFVIFLGEVQDRARLYEECIQFLSLFALFILQIK